MMRAISGPESPDMSCTCDVQLTAPNDALYGMAQSQPTGKQAAVNLLLSRAVIMYVLL
jgi:hypothetical protein